jgi:beta-lactam-binding protein with PASTA domain
VLARVTVPNVIGLPQAAAIEQLRVVGLKADVQTLPLKSVPAGFVVTQTPNAFSTTTTNAIIALGVSAAA